MKIVHRDLNLRMILKMDGVNRIIIENPLTFRCFILDIQAIEEGEASPLILSKESVPIDFSKKGELILDCFHLNLNDRRILNKIYENMENEILQSDLFESWNRITQDIEKMVEEAADALDLSVCYEVLDLKKMIRQIDLKLLTMEESIIDGLLEYLQFSHQWMGIDIFILVNAMSFFTQEDIKGMSEHARLNEYYLLLLDSHYLMIEDVKENGFIIDKDYCIIDLGDEAL